MPAYTVKQPAVCGVSTQDNTNTQVVFAATTTQAKEICAALFDGDNPWSGATVTEVTACTNWSGWNVRINICKGFGTSGLEPRSVSVDGSDTNETMAKVAALLVTALNALPVIANAAWDNDTHTLTIASAADGIGDAKVQVLITPPGGKAAVPSLVGTITHQGVAAAALTVVLPASDAVIPRSVAHGAT